MREFVLFLRHWLLMLRSSHACLKLAVMIGSHLVTVHGHHLTLATTRSPHQLSQLQNSETVQPLNIDIFIKEFDTI